MIKNIYIYYGSVASLFPLLACGKNNHAYFLQHGVYFPLLKNFTAPYTSTLDVYDQVWHAWLQGTLCSQYSEKNVDIAEKENIEAITLPTPQECVDNLTHFLKDQENIHTLCLCIDAYAHDKYCQVTLRMLEEVFPSAQINTTMLLLPQDRELEGSWIYLKHFHNVVPVDFYIKASIEKGFFMNNAEKTYKILQKYNKNLQLFYLESEKQALDILLKDINCDLTFDSYDTLFFSPKVLSFIQQFPKLDYPYGHYIYWWQEKALLQYDKQEKPVSYLNLAQRKEIRANHNRLSSLKYTYGKEEALSENLSCTDAPLSPQDALAMAALISSTLRQQLISFIDLDTLSQEDDTRRFVYGALLFVEKMINESEWDRLQEISLATNIENVYLHFTDAGSTSVLSEYCHQNNEILNEQGFYYPKLHDILPENIEVPLDFDSCGHRWLYQDASVFSLEQNMLYYFLSCKNRIFAKQKAYLAKNTSLKSICFLLQTSDSISDIKEFVERVQSNYPTAKIHVRFQLLPPDKQIEHLWVQSICQQKTSSSLAHLVQQTNRDGNLFHHMREIIQFLQKVFQDSVSVSLVDSEENAVKEWQASILLNNNALQASSKYRCLPSPEVIAFIISVQRMLERNISTAWFAEKDFWNYKQEKEDFSYLRPYWKQVIRDNFEKSTGINITSLGQIPHKDVSNAPLSIAFSQALTLASLLSRQCREQILQDISYNQVQYKSQTTRNVYAALLLVENRITQEQAQALVQEIKGQILPLHSQEHHQEETLPPKVTVLTMAYNHEKYIARCIESVLKQQTNFPVAHVIIDDFSTDGTRDILLEYAKKYPHITLVFNEYNAPATVACKLFDSIPSEYVALCDGDDYFHDPLKLQKQANMLDENPKYGLSFHLVMTLYEHDSGIGKIYPPVDSLPGGIQDKYSLLDLFKRNLIQTNSVMYRWRFQSQGLPAWYAYGTCPSDRYWHLIHAELGDIGFINEIMSVYWRHSEGHFYEAEVNPIAHRNTYGIQELILYDILDIHFEGCYAQICHSLSKNVLGDVINLLKQTQDPTYLKEVLKICPALKQYTISQKR